MSNTLAAILIIQDCALALIAACGIWNTRAITALRKRPYNR